MKTIKPRHFLLLIGFLLAFGSIGEAQPPAADLPAANPGRPTVASPATLTPVGYFQFETGYLGAWHSPQFSSQSSFNEAVKISVSRWIELLALWEPFARSQVDGQPSNAAGGVGLGVQGIVYHGEGVRPTISTGYLRQVYGGNAPDLDFGSPSNSLVFLASADVKGFHYDANLMFSEVNQDNVGRAQYGQALSVSHSLVGKYGLTGEIWHFTQPFLQSNAVGILWAIDYNAKKNLVFDAGFNRGLTSTSTRWEVFVGFTYLLPHKISFRRLG
jgi:hypothetical protein